MSARRLLMTRRSPYARKVRIALLEKGLACEEVDVNLARKPRELLQAGPVQKVPVLLDEHLTITDSTVICEYLEDRYPTPHLLPHGYLARADARMWEQTADEASDAAIRIHYARQRVGGPLDWRGMEHDQALLDRILDYAENVLHGRTWLVGGTYTLADIALACSLGYVSFRLGEGWKSRRSRLADYLDHLERRPTFRKTIPSV